MQSRRDDIKGRSLNDRPVKRCMSSAHISRLRRASSNFAILPYRFRYFKRHSRESYSANPPASGALPLLCLSVRKYSLGLHVKILIFVIQFSALPLLGESMHPVSSALPLATRQKRILLPFLSCSYLFLAPSVSLSMNRPAPNTKGRCCPMASNCIIYIRLTLLFLFTHHRNKFLPHLWTN